MSTKPAFKAAAVSISIPATSANLGPPIGYMFRETQK